MSRPRRPRPWYGQWTLAHRILAVNLLTIVLLACGVLYLDAFRNQLSEERLRLIQREAELTAAALATSAPGARQEALKGAAKASDSRVRYYGPDGSLRLDSWKLTGPTYQLRDPSTQKWTKDTARAADRAFNALVGAAPLDDFVEPVPDRLEAWPEALKARSQASTVTKARNAPDLTPVFSAATRADCSR